MSNGPSAIREQRERREIIAAESKLRQNEPQTLFSRARAGLDDADVPGGRYAAQAHFSGEAQSVSYPSGASWCGDAALLGPERPLGVAVDEMECTGTYVEIAQSIEALAVASSPTAGDLATSHSAPNPAVERREVAISPEDEATLKALLGRGLRRRKL